MKQQTFLQGSPEWHAHRLQHFNASDAPAMLGCSPYQTRTQLLHAMHTGLRADVDPATQRRFDDGHRFEALARPLAEAIIGEDLYPVVGSDGRLSASFDGLTMAEDTAFEHKTLNDDLRACMRDQGNGYSLPKHYQVQMEQQLMVSGAERVLFMASKWNGETLVEERHCWYASDPVLRAAIVAGWAQFEQDLAAYVPPAASTVEKIVAEPVEALPAPMVQVSGQLTLTDNFKAFEVRLRKFLDTELVRQPKTDEDFATLDLQIKAMKGAEAALESAEAQMLAQIQSVDQAKKTKDMLAELVRKNRLMAEKLLASEKERRKGDIVAGGVKALADHIAALNVRLGKPYMPQVPADFGGCIRGLKSLASMEDKVATELARAKIAANEIADRIQANLTALRDLAADHPFLFADTGTLVLKAPDDCRATITSRIGEHRQAEERRLEAERAKIRAEEEARARATAAREQQEREAAERRQREEQEAAARQAREQIEAAERRAHQATLTHPNGAPMFGEHIKENGDLLMLDAQGKRSVFCDIDEGDTPSANVHPMPTRAPAAPSIPTLKLGEIKARLAPLEISAAGLAQLGFKPAAREGAAVLFHEAEFPQMVEAMRGLLAAALRKQQEAA